MVMINVFMIVGFRSLINVCCFMIDCFFLIDGYDRRFMIDGFYDDGLTFLMSLLRLFKTLLFGSWMVV